MDLTGLIEMAELEGSLKDVPIPRKKGLHKEFHNENPGFNL